MRRARMTVAYKGDAFHGFAANPGVDSVESHITGALRQVLQVDIAIVAAGRTDAGVHGWGQVLSMDLPDSVDLAVLRKQLNALCGPFVVVREAEWVEPDFHARFSAMWRSYRYTVLNSPTPNPFMVDTAWHIHTPLKLRAMQLACDAVIGEHDFSAFCRKPKPSEGEHGAEFSMRRYVMNADWRDLGEGVLRFDIRANAFCHQMVRSLVGTFIEIGLGKRPPSDMRGLILSGDRNQAAQVAPPQGLCLWEVGYPADPGRL
jgi:tRNA pseudouridine38-40 synthase